MNTAIPATTQAWTTNFNGIPSLTLRSTPTPDPQNLPANHILVRILSVSLNYKDAEIINGLFRHHKSSVAPPDLVPCADSAGVVVALGPTTVPSTSSTPTPTPTPTWQPGDHVLSVSYPNYLTGPAKPEYLAEGVGSATNGVLTTYRVFPSHGAVACPPSLVDEPDLACCLPIAGTTAWMGLNWWRPLTTTTTTNDSPDAVDAKHSQDAQESSRESETLLLQGTGGVSTFGLLFARHMKMRTIITSSSDAKLRRAEESLGADAGINYRRQPDWDQEVLRLTGGEGVDIIFENGGGGPPATNSTLKSFRCVKFGGVINAIGYVGGKTDILSSSSSSSVSASASDEAASQQEQQQQQEEAARLNINVHALSRQITIKGLLNGPRDRTEEMLRFVEQHKIKPVVDRVFPFEEAKEALQYLWDGRHFGKVVIRVAADR